MQNPKYEDVATDKRNKGYTRKVLGVVDEVVFLSETQDHSAYAYACSISDFHKYYTIPQPKWVPKADERYWFIDGHGVDWTKNDELLGNKAHIAIGNCYKAKEEANEVWEKVRKCY